ncbi:hypothetical protein NDU88_004249 [Pleurodeles waltl]|uniref:Uncharacterized protein n=1 Tax=Pleurodeles waltl TaxID=8319 RepID=A0AAV7TS27_PLEWA|nr:hypothetical protein NDU88_004249 [Pleurodeles waltl]
MIWSSGARARPPLEAGKVAALIQQGAAAVCTPGCGSKILGWRAADCLSEVAAVVQLAARGGSGQVLGLWCATPLVVSNVVRSSVQCEVAAILCALTPGSGSDQPVDLAIVRKQGDPQWLGALLAWEGFRQDSGCRASAYTDGESAIPGPFWTHPPVTSYMTSLMTADLKDG